MSNSALSACSAVIVDLTSSSGETSLAPISVACLLADTLSCVDREMIRSGQTLNSFFLSFSVLVFRAFVVTR